MSACPVCGYHTGHDPAMFCARPVAAPAPPRDEHTPSAPTGAEPTREPGAHGRTDENVRPCAPHFDGETYEPEADHARLTGQLAGVLDLMRDGRWRTLAEIAEHVDGSEAGVSARLRDLRKARFGGYEVEKRRRTESLWEYRLDVETAKENAA